MLSLGSFRAQVFRRAFAHYFLKRGVGVLIISLVFDISSVIIEPYSQFINMSPAVSTSYILSLDPTSSFLKYSTDVSPSYSV